MNGLTQARAKQIRALRQKKDRDAEGLFLVEGAKAVGETLLAGWPVRTLLCTESYLKKNPSLPLESIPEVMLCSEQQLSETGNFKNNNAALLVAEQRNESSLPDPSAALWLATENLADPGNLGTLIRLADWFGLSELLCLGSCVEWYNPKVIAASMGSFLRVKECRIQPETILSSGREILSADMDGENVFSFRFPAKAALLIGSEAAGLSAQWLMAPARKITIPSFGAAESLNAAMAGGILLSHWKKQNLGL